MPAVRPHRLKHLLGADSEDRGAGEDDTVKPSNGGALVGCAGLTFLIGFPHGPSLPAATMLLGRLKAAPS
jgi:hypothetical protein